MKKSTCIFKIPTIDKHDGEHSMERYLSNHTAKTSLHDSKQMIFLSHFSHRLVAVAFDFSFITLQLKWMCSNKNEYMHTRVSLIKQVKKMFDFN